ncbi:hypothetical protein BpHYR1_037801 [Brachionus plicatilis]|uniref:UPAR/Ly6 domain-containing protein n=1 Tax=Brachionus plicatilis TaxID=10195 RepID=A0A3M7QP15_BRAPC|nr:hypothetical protein BpHYR1_037801 [Brachionus plicatilis]
MELIAFFFLILLKMLWLQIVALLAAFCALESASSNLTCFECSSSSNEACNSKAIDQPCTIHNAVCMTTHTFLPDQLQSLSVEKKCVAQCSAELIGCRLSQQLHPTQYKFLIYLKKCKS